MWQEILAVDSKIADVRGSMAQVRNSSSMEANVPLSSSSLSQDKEFKPLYLKRRLQLLQSQEQGRSSSFDSSMLTTPSTSSGLGPVRNKRYLSLRVKLLKRQFGLPSDVLSLKNLSLQSREGNVVGKRLRMSSTDDFFDNEDSTDPDLVNENDFSHMILPKASKDNKAMLRNEGKHSGENAFAKFSGMLHIIEGSLSGTIQRMKVSHNATFFVCACSEGGVSIVDLQEGNHNFLTGNNGSQGVNDIDLSESDELIVSASKDGDLVLWHVDGRKQLRCILPAELSGRVLFSRFLPQNSNLVVCCLSTGFVDIFNVSTGKFQSGSGGGCPVLGKTTCIEISPQGDLLWVGNDRGYVESFRIEYEHGLRMRKGCRLMVSKCNSLVKSLSYRNNFGSCVRNNSLNNNPCIMAVTEHSHTVQLFSVVDNFGTLAPFSSISVSLPTSCAIFAPIMTSFTVGACIGSEDGSVAFLDVTNSICINKILGHSASITAVAFSPDEKVLVTAEASGQVIVWKK